MNNLGKIETTRAIPKAKLEMINKPIKETKAAVSEDVKSHEKAKDIPNTSSYCDAIKEGKKVAIGDIAKR